MKKCTLIIYMLTSFIFLSLTHKTNAQTQNANWYFGTQAGLNFNDGTLPPTLLTNSSMSTEGSSASISDSSGNLLFYTNGINVWDSNHQIMTNGSGLFGNTEINQSVIIVPDSNNANQYYIFTNRGNVMGLSGLYYSIVDMSLNSGLGDIDSSQKNILLQEEYGKNITAILNPNDDTYWLVVFGYGNDATRNDTFYCYKVDNLGVNLTNQSTFTFNLDESLDNIDGQMKISPDGQTLALISNTVGAGRNGEFEEAQSIFTFDFDDNTGVVSLLNESILLNDSLYSYGVEFSPYSNFLYVTTTNKLLDGTPVGRIYQIEYKSSDIATLIYEGLQPIYGLQLAIDEKIYAVNSSGNLGVIDDPNISGSGANYSHESIDLGVNAAVKELPQLTPNIPITMSLMKVFNTSYSNDTITKLKAKDTGLVVFGKIGADNEDDLPGLGSGFIAEYSNDNNLLSSEIQQIPYQTQLNLEENTYKWEELPTSMNLNGESNNNYKLSKFNDNNQLDFEITTTNINEDLIEDITSDQTYLLFPTSSYQDFEITGVSGRKWTKNATQIFVQDSTVFTKTYNLARFDNSGTLINVIELLNYKWARDSSSGTGLVDFPAKIVGDANMLYFTTASRDEDGFTEATKINLNNGDFYKKGEWLVSYDVRNSTYKQSKLIGQAGSLIPNELIYNQSSLFIKRKNDIYKLDESLNEIDSLSFTKLEILESNSSNGTMIIRGGNNRTIKKIDANFNEIWSRNLGKKFTITNASEAPNGNVYVSGSYTEDAKFSNPDEIDLIHNFGSDTFIAQIEGLPIEVSEMKSAINLPPKNELRNSLRNDFEKKFVVYPNPFLNNISIKSTLESNYSIEIYDQKGSLITKKNAIKKDSNLNTSKLKSGIYYLKIIDSNSKIIEKSIIKI